MNGNMNLGSRISRLENEGGGGGSSTQNKGHVYSTEEQIVGNWIDGKPLYELTFDGNELNIPNVDHLHFVQSMAHSSTYDNYDQIPMPGNGVRWMFSKTNENLTLLDPSGFHDTYNTTIQYTKTTDTPILK